MSKSNYIIIPEEIELSPNLMPGAKLLYGRLLSLARDKGYCWSTNKYLGGLYGTSNRTIQSWLLNLRDNDCIQIEYIMKDGSKEIELRKITPMKKKSSPHEEKFTGGDEENITSSHEENFTYNNINTNNINIKRNNILFLDTNFDTYSEYFSGDKGILHIAFKLWDTFVLISPHSITHKKATVNEYYQIIHDLIIVCKQPVERILLVSCYLSYVKKHPKFEGNSFYFGKILGPAELLQVDANGIYKLDKVIGVINESIKADSIFSRACKTMINNFFTTYPDHKKTNGFNNVMEVEKMKAMPSNNINIPRI
ncbi:helix-turn-helix domain-containing protein [Elizabethkingia anophelis]|uniref:helix-turn-helix domain-containing protein n=1 Tax=Elizabethkingia TaxID=308865 RepID=UPI00073985CB|nr:MULTISPECIES: helix-turn-helix domain-containing protein [Elizabethkingia]KUF46413.1 hypothetical protein AS358_14520 [Elizabethkingia anophelis]MCT3645171.1 helix-turn-helix domain-containing protein [Elizabethkingia anophelis]MCT3652978.1 helix-turn-helix domain-containing protein [Elizabethkingia anophelis]MCT3656152.1 helix-turn-helix domain-containing protein [Elizabethkingia anophelis]MCT3660200.1 helix-turn-helix domain-containing protein [Elizabethkingia anophelis]